MFCDVLEELASIFFVMKTQVPRANYPHRYQAGYSFSVVLILDKNDFSVIFLISEENHTATGENLKTRFDSAKNVPGTQK